MFLKLVWAYLGLPSPTPLQYSIAYQLQHGPRRQMIQAFRGVGKSWITVAFVLWLLFLNPQLKILVVSASQPLADDFSRFAKSIIKGMPLLQHLTPDSLDQAIRWDVAGVTDSKDPSVKSAGITGQITGNRADVIIVDDAEIPKNSYTHLLRERLAELVKEFDAIVKPKGRIVYLGTPQVEGSLYNRLPARGYTIMVWPELIPENADVYNGRLAPYVTKRLAKNWPPLTPLEPTRFGEDEIAQQKRVYGISGFELQFMLNTTPSDIEKHPLKTRDLIIGEIDLDDMGYVKLVWGSGGDEIIRDLVSGGFDGDYYCRAAWKSDGLVPFQGTVMAIDPSGKGSDETSYAIIRYLNGMLYLVAVGGFTDGFGLPTLKALAVLMVRHKVNYWVAEENYGGGMFAQLLKPVIQQEAERMRLNKESTWPGASFDEEYDGWASTQKEQRILDTLTPVLKAHRLVVSRRVIEADLKVQGDLTRYSFIQQMTRLERTAGCLPNEDRVEAVSMACNYWTERMARNVDRAEQEHRESLIDAELVRFMNATVNFGRPVDEGGRWRSGR